MRKYKFAPMLGPAHRQQHGTREWAECVGNELEYMVEWAVEFGVDDIIPLIRKALSVDPAPGCMARPTLQERECVP